MATVKVKCRSCGTMIEVTRFCIRPNLGGGYVGPCRFIDETQKYDPEDFCTLPTACPEGENTWQDGPIIESKAERESKMYYGCKYLSLCPDTTRKNEAVSKCSKICEQTTEKQMRCLHREYTVEESQLYCDGGMETMYCQSCGLRWQKSCGSYTRDYEGWKSRRRSLKFINATRDAECG